jgi:hypothetical protein
MSWLKRIFGSRREEARLERLVRRLISPDEATFLDALREATALAPKGDDLGVRALSEAIHRKSGRQDATFYAPAFGKLTVIDKSVEAKGEIIQLAESQALLSDPAKSQNLIFMAMAHIGGDLRDPLMVTSDGQNLISAAITV